MFDENKSREKLLAELKKSQEINHELRATLKNNEKSNKELIKDERFLSKSAMELVEIPENDDIHEFAASKMELIFKDSIIMLTSCDEKSETFGLACIKGLDSKKMGLLKKVLGKNFMDTTVHFNDMETALQKCLYRREFKELKNGLYAATGGIFPKRLCKLVEKLIGIKEVYGIGLLWDNKLYGAVAVFSYDENTLKKKDIVETLVNMVSVALQRRQIENKIKKALEEKEILMKEIHHRSKNNLMVISSLLNLQSKYIKDSATREIFKESQDRARSMALIHERLYGSADLKRINFGDYIKTLTLDLFRSYMGDSSHINLNLNIENLMMDVNTAMPLGLIVNELITNCMKYAFPASFIHGSTDVTSVDPMNYSRGPANKKFADLATESCKFEDEKFSDQAAKSIGQANDPFASPLTENCEFANGSFASFHGNNGEINLEFYEDGDKFVLKVADNGVGVPDDLDFRNTSSLGLQLVNILTDQIHGKIELDKTNGTEFKITFKEFGR